jgi:hypothetical protein
MSRDPHVTRLVTVVELLTDTPAQLRFSARLLAELDDGRRVVLLDDRGWTESPGGRIRDEEVAFDARSVVGPDERYGDRTQEDMDRGHFETLAQSLRRSGVDVDAGALALLPHDVEHGKRLATRLETA